MSARGKCFTQCCSIGSMRRLASARRYRHGHQSTWMSQGEHNGMCHVARKRDLCRYGVLQFAGASRHRPTRYGSAIRGLHRGQKCGRIGVDSAKMRHVADAVLAQPNLTQHRACPHPAGRACDATGACERAPCELREIVALACGRSAGAVAGCESAACGLCWPVAGRNVRWRHGAGILWRLWACVGLCWRRVLAGPVACGASTTAAQSDLA
jgi:hypothetical protein